MNNNLAMLPRSFRSPPGGAIVVEYTLREVFTSDFELEGRATDHHGREVAFRKVISRLALFSRLALCGARDPLRVLTHEAEAIEADLEAEVARRGRPMEVPWSRYAAYAAEYAATYIVAPTDPAADAPDPFASWEEAVDGEG